MLGVELLGERLGPYAWLGGALILAAAITLTTRGHETRAGGDSGVTPVVSDISVSVMRVGSGPALASVDGTDCSHVDRAQTPAGSEAQQAARRRSRLPLPMGSFLRGVDAAAVCSVLWIAGRAGHRRHHLAIVRRLEGDGLRARPTSDGRSGSSARHWRWRQRPLLVAAQHAYAACCRPARSALSRPIGLRCLDRRAAVSVAGIFSAAAFCA